jgi:predicted dehydrogenase
MYRTAIIGGGRIGVEFDDCHARAYKENPDCELLAIIDKRLDLATKAGEKWDIPIVGNQYETLGELGLDIVSICTPPQTHYEVLKDMLVINPNLKAIYCEKPISIELKEAEEMVELCKEKNVILQVNHQRRFGVPTFYYSRGLFNTGTHLVDMLRMFFGNPVNVTKNTLWFKNIVVKIQELDIDKPVFEFKIDTTDAIKTGVRHLLYCIEHNTESISSGEEALEDLRVLWSLKLS